MNKTSNSIIEQYVSRTPRSGELATKARELMPSGLAHDGRRTDPYPVYIQRAEGPRKWDVDGNEYVDYFGGHGSLLLGHNFPAIKAAIAEQLERGTHYGACHEAEIEWARLITELVPSAEKVRFTSSGTEATLLGLRVARAFSGREKILRIRGHFHGWHDHMASGYASHFDGTPAAGVIGGIAKSTVLVDAENTDQLETALSKGDVAAAIVEPNGAHFGRFPMSREYLAALRRLTTETGTILIFDEVVTGFRVAPGGMQSITGILPDMTTLAKILAGGLPGGALVGRHDIMDVLDIAAAKARGFERISHPGTYNANPLSAAAGIAMLTAISDGRASERANEAGARLRDGFNAVFSELDIPWAAYGEFAGFYIFPNPLKRPIDPLAFDTTHVETDLKHSSAGPLLSMVRTGLLALGVDVNGQASGWVSAVHGDREIEDTIDSVRSLVLGLKRDGFFAR